MPNTKDFTGSRGAQKNWLIAKITEQKSKQSGRLRLKKKSTKVT